MSLRRQLLDALDPLGFRDGRIALPVLWPAVKAWWLEPAPGTAPSEDERTFYLSEAPGDGTDSFAGTPPAALGGQDLICIELGRELRTRTSDTGLVLWYADGPAWAPLAAEDGWIAQGPGTPHIDASARGDDTARLVDFVESSLAFAIASRQPPRAAEIADGVADNIVVLAAGT